MPKLVQVIALPAYRLWVQYSDGIEGEVDLSHLVGKGVFSYWEASQNFEQVHLGPGGAIAWSDQIDLCPDAIYMRLAGKKPAG